jgi:hypothetical protein
MRRAFMLAALLLTSLVAIALSATPAAGTPPQVVIFKDQGFFGLSDVSCDGFELLYTLLGERVTEITHFDDAGNPVRVRDTFVVEGRFTNSVTGETFRDHAAGLFEIDLTTGVTSVAGLQFNYHSTGEGLLFLDAGRRIQDADGNLLFVAGPTDFEGGGIDAICAALG